jgi:hypothetical protein
MEKDSMKHLLCNYSWKFWKKRRITLICLYRPWSVSEEHSDIIGYLCSCRYLTAIATNPCREQHLLHTEVLNDEHGYDLVINIAKRVAVYLVHDEHRNVLKKLASAAHLIFGSSHGHQRT